MPHNPQPELLALEVVIDDMLKNTEHQLHILAARFVGFCQDLWKSPTGQEFIQFLAGLAHPYRHAPSDSPHFHGRAEMVAILIRYGAMPDGIPSLVPPSETKPNKTHDTRTEAENGRGPRARKARKAASPAKGKGKPARPAAE